MSGIAACSDFLLRACPALSFGRSVSSNSNLAVQVQEQRPAPGACPTPPITDVDSEDDSQLRTAACSCVRVLGDRS